MASTKSAPAGECWLERLQLAKTLGFDFVEMSVDETDDRLSRLDWSREQRLALVNAIVETGVRVPSMCLSAHRRFRWEAKMTRCGRRGWRLCVKLSSSPRTSAFA
ncbi:TIM barrel protein [Escherichia coli]